MRRRLPEAVGGMRHLKKSRTVEKLKPFIRLQGMFAKGQSLGLIVVTAHVGNRKPNFINDGFLRHDLSCFRRLGCLMRLAAL